MAVDIPVPNSIAQEIAQRRTFAIISHPDAGKTTLTEKFLLYAGMLRTAGMVQGRKNRKYAASDWMQMEQERGISITASAMQFHFKDVVFNLLDTPGHQDFSEDTYRTLTAADAAVMVIDSAKGVEAQTIKLFKVCRLRKIPILCFMNKFDLPGREPLDLMAELESVLGIHSTPMNWPIGTGRDFRGVYDRRLEQLFLFQRGTDGGSHRVETQACTLKEAQDLQLVAPERFQQLAEELDLLNHAGNPFSMEQFLAGELVPVFFGSALTNFGVEMFLDNFVRLAPPPGARPARTSSGVDISISPAEAPFSAYVFKIQANMDPRHRDSMAFLRICSGQFERDLVVKHERLGKELRLSRSHAMLGGERNTIDFAYPGDIVGVVNPGVFAIGDTVSLKGGFSFKPLPKFPPEIVANIRPKDVMKRKGFDKGVLQLQTEGSILALRKLGSLQTYPMVAAVGPLQFEVLQYRLENEYGVKTELETLPYRYGTWLVGNSQDFETSSTSILALDPDDKVILLFTYEWERRYLQERNPKHQFLDFVEGF